MIIHSYLPGRMGGWFANPRLKLHWTYFGPLTRFNHWTWEWMPRPSLPKRNWFDILTCLKTRQSSSRVIYPPQCGALTEAIDYKFIETKAIKRSLFLVKLQASRNDDSLPPYKPREKIFTELYKPPTHFSTPLDIQARISKVWDHWSALLV